MMGVVRHWNRFVHRSGGPIPGSVPGHAGLRFEYHDLVKGIPIHGWEAGAQGYDLEGRPF